MGIRFICPNGHKLNVKAHLAGQRGLCPDCGAKVLIPLESRLAGGKAVPGVMVDVPAVAKLPVPGVEPAELDLQIFEELDFSALESTPVTRTSPPPLRRPSSPRDPSPEVVWYVRLPSGGQFGPATRDVIWSWIEAGRVPSDSLVWQEGWRDWQVASAAFSPVAGGEEPEWRQTNTSQRSSPASGRRTARQPSDSYRTLAVILLAVIAVILSGVLIWVLI